MEGAMDPKDTIVPETRDKDVSEPEDRSGIEPEDGIGTDVGDKVGPELRDRGFTDPEGSDAEEPDDRILIEPEDPEEQHDGKDEENIFASWIGHCKRAAEQEDTDQEEQEREAAIEERKSSCDRQAPPRIERRQSLPCLAQLSAMTQLSSLYNATMAPSPVRPNSRPCMLSTIPDLAELPKMKAQTQFRRRNVMSLSDADRVCLICRDDLHRRGSGVRELHCSHSFHSECIEEWLWRKQTCPTCCVQLPVPEPLYWSSTRVKVP